MKWITRERPKIDRIACPWLIKKFVDKEAEFIYTLADKVKEQAKILDAIPFDVPDVEYSHYEDKCTFDYIVQKLQTDKKFRNYKNKSLSDEAGFGSTQIFTRTFKAKIGMPPTIFISELRKKLLE